MINKEDDKNWSCQTDKTDVSIAQGDNYMKPLTWQTSMAGIVEKLNGYDNEHMLAGRNSTPHDEGEVSRSDTNIDQRNRL